MESFYLFTGVFISGLSKIINGRRLNSNAYRVLSNFQNDANELVLLTETRRKGFNDKATLGY